VQIDVDRALGNLRIEIINVFPDCIFDIIMLVKDLLGEANLYGYKESLKSANSDHLDKIGKSKRE